MYTEKIGIVGGFGAYATLDFYRRILEEFKKDSERDYPHIIMDNNFTMPSRTRALLYGEDYDKVVNDIAESLKLLCEQGAGYIVLVCGTAHAFLTDVYKIIPQAESRVINLIELTGRYLDREQIRRVLIIAAEGTLKEDIYGRQFAEIGLTGVTPDETYYSLIRECIESVKTNCMNENIADKFLDLLDMFAVGDVILGCTEFPILVDYISNLDIYRQRRLKKYRFWNPLELVILELKKKLK